MSSKARHKEWCVNTIPLPSMSAVQLQGQVRAAEAAWGASVSRTGWVLAREIILSPPALALLGVVVGLDLFSRTLLPLGIATSPNRVEHLGPELRLLLFASLTLLILLHVARWRTAMRGLDALGTVVIVVASGLYVHLFFGLAACLPSWILFRGSLGIAIGAVGESLWLSSLAGILALGRHAPRTLGLALLLLSWWVPILGRLDLARPAWSAEGILPMLVPHLLATAYVCLGRAQR